jgi:homoserine kinase
LSGAGPAVLLLTISEEAASDARNIAARELEEAGKIEFLTCRLENKAITF